MAAISHAPTPAAAETLAIAALLCGFSRLVIYVSPKAQCSDVARLHNSALLISGAIAVVC
jgi:hypothetical protein